MTHAEHAETKELDKPDSQRAQSCILSYSAKTARNHDCGL